MVNQEKKFLLPFFQYIRVWVQTSYYYTGNEIDLIPPHSVITVI